MHLWFYFWTQFAGALNDNLFKTALIIWITFGAAGVAAGDQGTLVILCSGIFILPFFLFSATAGWLADRYPRDRVIRWIKFAEIAIMIVGAIGFLANSIPLLILVLFLMGTHSAWFGPAKYGIVPQLAGERGLMRANGLVEMGTFIAILGGTLLGGIIVTHEQGRALAAVAIVGIAIFGWSMSLRIPRQEPAAPGLAREGNIFTETSRRLRSLSGMRGIFPLVVSISWFWFHGSFILQLLPLWVKEHGTGDASLTTIVLLLFSCGIGIGSLLSGRKKSSTVRTGQIVPALLALALGSIFAGLAGNTLELALPALALTGIAAGFYSVPLYAAVQSRVRPEERARIFAGGNILDAAFMVAASLAMQGLQLADITTGMRFVVLGALDLVFLFCWIRPKTDLVADARHLRVSTEKISPNH